MEIDVQNIYGLGWIAEKLKASSSYLSHERDYKQDGDGDKDDSREEDERRQSEDKGFRAIEQRDRGPQREQKDRDARGEEESFLQEAMVQQRALRLFAVC